MLKKKPDKYNKLKKQILNLLLDTKKNLIILASMTPKSLVYDQGVLKDINGKKIEQENKPEKPKRRDYPDYEQYTYEKNKYQNSIKAWKEQLVGAYYEIDLRYKTLTLLESPSYECFEFLKVIMSHDSFESKYKVVNKSSKGQNITINVVLKGWPSTIILGTDKKYMEEYASRVFTVTPSASLEKISSANKLTNDKACYPWLFEEESITKQAIRQLITEIRNVVLKEKIKIIIPFPNFYKCFNKEVVRDMRDFQHLIQFVKTFTLLRVFQRPIIKVKEQMYALTTKEDIVEALTIFEEIIETTRTNTEERILTFYKKVFLTLNKPQERTNENNSQTKLQQEEKEIDIGLTVEEATKKYNEGLKKKVSDHRVRKHLNRLNKIGYLDKRKNENLSRKLNLYYPLVDKPENIGISEMQIYLESKIEKDCENWVNRMFTKQESMIIYNISTIGKESYKITEYSIKKEEIIKKLVILSYDFVNIESDLETALISENKPENIGVLEKQIKSTSYNNLVFFQKLHQPGEKCFECEALASEYLIFFPENMKVKFPFCPSCFEKEKIKNKGQYRLEEKRRGSN